ncbi:hypothetical protein [Nitrobacter sp. TKz-YC02]|uniref:hypothetical protein n=1 Tax=Nitrobacter sp. TKz-YC02 TaxID=3398704 RepID=UPI003CF2E2F8
MPSVLRSRDLTSRAVNAAATGDSLSCVDGCINAQRGDVRDDKVQSRWTDGA